AAAAVSSNSYPFGITTGASASYMTMWTAAQLQEVGFIESFGWQHGSLATANATSTWANVKYYMGYSNVNSPITVAAPGDYPTYFISPPTLVYDGPLTMTVPAGGTGAFHPRTQLTTPFLYDGSANLCLYIELSGPPTGTTFGQWHRTYSGGGLPNYRAWSTSN